MKLLALLVILLAVPATASAAETIGLEGSELVYRTDPVEGDRGAFLLMSGDKPDELLVVGGDSFSATAPTAVIVGGPGDDYLDVYNTEAAPGPFRVDGGPGKDTLAFAGRAPGAMLNGGDGDDLLAVALTGPDGVPVEAPARTTVTLRRRTRTGTIDGTLIARRTVQAPAGLLRVQLKTTDAGRRLLRRAPKLPLWVSIKARTGSDSAEVIFASKLG